MKNLQKLFSMAMLVCMAVAMFSCSKDDEAVVSATEADIMGEWTVTSSDVNVKGAEVSELEKAILLLLAESEGNVFEFEGEGKFTKKSKSIITLTDSDDDVTYEEEGTWKLEGGNKVIITDEDDEETSYEIRSLNGESATIVEATSENGVTMEIITNMKK